MKCQKCNFVSFDHLSECKNCGVDLKTIRESMGYLPFEPVVPFLLGTLLKSHAEAPVKTEAWMKAEQPTEEVEVEMELDDAFELGTIELTPDAEGAAVTGSPGQVQLQKHLDSALKAFEEIETLELTSAPPSPKAPESDGVGDMEIDFVLEEEPFDIEPLKMEPSPRQPSVTGMPVSLKKETGTSPAKSPDDELTDEDLARLVHEATLDEDLDFQMDIEEIGSPPKSPPPTAAKSTPKAELDDIDLELDLDKDDLETLILEMDEADTTDAAKAGKQPSRDKPK